MIFVARFLFALVFAAFLVWVYLHREEHVARRRVDIATRTLPGEEPPRWSKYDILVEVWTGIGVACILLMVGIALAR